MCDVCGDLLNLFRTYDERLNEGGFQLSKEEILQVIQYVQNAPPRQCMCCYRDPKNLDKFNNIIQVMLKRAIALLRTLPDKPDANRHKGQGDIPSGQSDRCENKKLDKEQGQGDTSVEKTQLKQSGSTSEDLSDGNPEDKSDSQTTDASGGESSEAKTVKINNSSVASGEKREKDPDKNLLKEDWSLEEKEKLFHFVNKIFLTNFPLYRAYKCIMHNPLEELTPQEAGALNNYCEITDPEVPVLLLHNVCFFSDNRGVQAIAHCFQHADTEMLPYNVAHALIMIIANLRLWMNMQTVVRLIVPLRTYVIRYMCRLSDNDLRLAGTRNMTELMWQAVKEPMDGHFTFDREGLELAFKYFMCSTLTIRLAGITQINSQISLYNEFVNNDSIMETESIGNNLANWLVENKIIEHLFGPNLHVEVIKQSQVILNLLAIEGRITAEHMDCMWAAGQLKHCGRPVLDLLKSLIKHLDVQPVLHLMKLVSLLDVSAHTEQTLYLAQALTKYIWQRATNVPRELLDHQHSHICHAGEEGCCAHAHSSSEHSDSEEELEEGLVHTGHRHVPPGPVTPSSVPNTGGPSGHRPQFRHMRKIGCSLDVGKARRVVKRSDESEPSDGDSSTSEMSEAEKGLRRRAPLSHKAAHIHPHGHHHDDEETSEEYEDDDEEDDEDELGDSEDEVEDDEEPLTFNKGHRTCSEDCNCHKKGKVSPARRFQVKKQPQSEKVQTPQRALPEKREPLPKNEASPSVKRADMTDSSPEDGKNKCSCAECKERADLHAQMAHHPHIEELNITEETAAMLQSMAQSGGDSEETGLSDAEQLPRQSTKHMTEAEINICLEHIQAQGFSHPGITRELLTEMLSPEDDHSCNSSRMSAKSEKNMGDFDGENILSDDEISQITGGGAAVASGSGGSAARHGGHVISEQHMQSHLAAMAENYQAKHNQQGHSPKHDSQALWKTVRMEDVCKPGNTLLWDLIQEPNVCKLPEGLAEECEKIVTNLICFAQDVRIRTRFIEACIDNVKNYRSVVISLRLLPKLFSSFQHMRESDLNTYGVTRWAEKELFMLKHFFNDLLHYTQHRGTAPTMHLYSHKEEVQVRLSFLTYVFTCAGSHFMFKLTLEQVDTLWNCLATDSECSDQCFQWFLQQAQSKDHHALGLEAFKHVFLEKMPSLQCETMSMLGLKLYTSLCGLAHIANSNLKEPLPEESISGMDMLWGIALRAQNTDVSLTAIQYLNSHYINYGQGNLEKEEEFVRRCMDSLMGASSHLEQSPESNLLVIQRGLTLLTSHLESFRKRFGYHLRNWQLDGKGIFSHQKGIKEKQSSLVRLQLQQVGSADRTTLEMLSTDLVAELRAEVTRWWQNLQRQHQQKLKELNEDPNPHAKSAGSILKPILGAMLGEGPIRMVSGGLEFSVDFDEKTLAEVQIKDQQIVFVSPGANRPGRKQDGATPPSYLPAPSRNKIPMMLLLQDPHFKNVFSLLRQLSDFRPADSQADSQEVYSLQTKAKVLSRKVWDLLMVLPTNPKMLKGFQNMPQKQQSDPDEIKWGELLDDSSAHKLMYSLQIVEYLSRPPRLRKASIFLSRSDSRPESMDSEMSVDDNGPPPEEMWSNKFVSNGGMQHLFSIFMSGKLQVKDSGVWNEWRQDCLAYLLRLVSQFAVIQSDADSHEEVFDNLESPRKKLRKIRSERVVIPRLNPDLLCMIDVPRVVDILLNILRDAAMPPREHRHWPVASWGRVEVVHYALAFLVSFAHSCKHVLPALTGHELFAPWLQRMTLEAPEPPVRQEACQGLYRLCLGRTADGQTGANYLMPVLTSLLSNLDAAQVMRTPKKRHEEQKEPYGPACRDYFWIVCHLTDSVSREDAIASWSGGPTQNEAVRGLDLNALTDHVAGYIRQRGYLERRHDPAEDDGLIGLLNLVTSLMKLDPPFRTTAEGQAFMMDIFWCLFALPAPNKRVLPKCKSQTARSSAYDLLVEMVRGSVENYAILHDKLLLQNSKDPHLPYSWDMWPCEEERSTSGFVGLTNLGATCYMATCMQHLYMIPEARKCILEADQNDCLDTRHKATLMQLQHMFTYLLESERKAYNPRNFCKVYTMDHQPLNTGEQKDMTEFFTDLISKMEEMGPNLKRLVKNLFGGVQTNNVVSLDCTHVSRTKEEFYTVRCQVADMRNLQESLDEVTVKDMLEGDNMYTCSKCQKKVRAEKRACFKKLPKILCFNTMRYTFNMVTMLKEKVNTHFSFPPRLDMSPYMERNLIKKERLQADESEKSESDDDEDTAGYMYELIGVTVHTGTAEGGHYYSFIRDKQSVNELGQNKWYLFNDAEVKAFDPALLATECFGGEMTSKTYDTVTDKFMDFSWEKTNSAYMLFYERIPEGRVSIDEPMRAMCTEESEVESHHNMKIELSEELNDWIWQDNKQFLRDKNIFEHGYFSFVWQMASFVPSTLPRDTNQGGESSTSSMSEGETVSGNSSSDQSGPGSSKFKMAPKIRRRCGEDVKLMVSKLSTSFVLETLIHSKEKPTMLQWIELVTKQFNKCHQAGEWFLDHMAQDDWWPQQILIKCPNQVVRQMFHRLVIHVITSLQSTHSMLYLREDDVEGESVATLGNSSCVTRFIKKMLAIIAHGPRPHCKYLSEYFAFLLDFAKLGEREAQFLLRINAIATMVYFFLSHKQHDTFVEILSDDEEEEDDQVLPVNEDRYRPQSLEKMIHLIAYLVEKSRQPDNQLGLSERDHTALMCGKGFHFLFNQIKDNINIRQTCNLMFSLSRWNDRVALALIQMIFTAITRLGVEQSQPFFKMLSLLVEMPVAPPGMPQFTQYILHKFWDVADFCPQQSLEWLSTQVIHNKLAHAWTSQNLDWVEHFLITNNNPRVRNAAAGLLIALVPSNHFRNGFRQTNRGVVSPFKDKSAMTEEAVLVMHDIYKHLLRLLPRAKTYIDIQKHGTTKLVSYFTVLSYCLVSRTEKLMFSRHFGDLWTLFQPGLSEPAIAMHNNKQALLHFWHMACIDCIENVKHIVTNPHVCKTIAYIYILADHQDQELMMFNRTMLPSYYGILRLACQASRTFTRQLAAHQNIQWAFENLTPYPGQYPTTYDELMKMMRLMVTVHSDSTDEEIRAINKFKHDTISLYLQQIEARTSWQTLIMVLKTLLLTTDDKVQVLRLGGLHMLQQAFNTVYMMHNEATACHVAMDLIDLLGIVQDVLKTARDKFKEKKIGGELKAYAQAWKEKNEFINKLLTLLNSYQPSEIRQATLDVLREMVLTYQSECLQIVAPILVTCHQQFQDNGMPIPMGPYFPKRGEKLVPHKMNVRLVRPQFQMFLQSNILECSKGIDEDYDKALSEFFMPYHTFVDLLMRVSVNQGHVLEKVIKLNAMVAYEGVPLHMPLFAKLWYEIYQSENVDKKYLSMLSSTPLVVDYVNAVLMDERASLSSQHIYQFFVNFFPKIHQQVLGENGETIWENILQSLMSNRELYEKALEGTERDINKVLNRINGDLKALMLILSVQRGVINHQDLIQQLALLNHTCRSLQRERAAMAKRMREEQERRERAAQQEARERRELERREAVERGENPPEVESGGEEEVPTKRRKTSAESTSGSDESSADNADPPSDNDKIDKPDTKKSQQNSSKSGSDTEKEVSSCDDNIIAGKKQDPLKNQENAKDDQKETSEAKISDLGTAASNEKSSQSKEAKVLIHDKGSSDEARPSTSASTKRKATPEKEDKSGISKPEVGRNRRPMVREKPTLLDQVIRHIENVFGLLNPPPKNAPKC